MRSIVMQKRNSVDFMEVMNNRKIVLVDLCKGKLGETNSSFLAMILSSLIQRAAFKRKDAAKGAGMRDFYLYVDEFQNVATESFATMLAEARKYKLNLILTNQHLGQLGLEIQNAVFGNVGTFLSFRTGIKDAEDLEDRFLPYASKNDIISLPNFHAYVSSLARGEALKPFSLRTKFDLPPKDKTVVEGIIKGASRYGRPRAAVEAEIEESVGKLKKAGK